MPAPVSVIIPTLNAAGRIGPCLGALGEGATSGLIREVILADGGSDDDIAEVAEVSGARLIEAPRGRGRQLAAGAEDARGDWLLFLHADCVLPADWPARLQSHIETAPGRAGFFRLAFAEKGVPARLIAGWANLRSRVFALPYGDQGLFLSRAVYRSAGGFPDLPLMEDVALVRRLGRKRLRMLDAAITTSAERYRRDGWVRRGARNLTTLALYFLGASPERLVRHYRGRG